MWRLGFCYKLTYTNFLNRYKMLSLHTWPHWTGTPFEGVSYLVRSLPIPSAEFIFGRTKLFVRSPRTVSAFFYVKLCNVSRYINRMSLLGF